MNSFQPKNCTQLILVEYYACLVLFYVKVWNFAQKSLGFLYDYAIPHTELIDWGRLAKLTHIVMQLTYSPDLALSDFWLFLKLKVLLCGHHFHSIEENAELTKALMVIKEKKISGCFDEWKNVSISALYRVELLWRRWNWFWTIGIDLFLKRIWLIF